jgi:two-component system, chemotaxis family, CheB/CheR fusion protein
MPMNLVADVIGESVRPTLPAKAASEADHRIANNLMIIAGLIRSQAARLPAAPMLPTEQVRDWFEEMSLRIDAVGRLHALLRADTGSARVDLATYLREVAQAAKASLSHAERTEVSFDLPADCEISAKQGAGIGLLVTEAMTNAFKYSHPTGVAGKLSIAARREHSGGLAIEIADDGVGLPEGFDTKDVKSNGLRLMRAAAAQLRGRLDFEQTPLGLCVRLELPA